MARDSNGNYQLPAGNPVISGTTISSAWANTTMADIANALTDSLDRQGRGGMLAPLRFSDGSPSAPSVAFTNEPNAGMYRIGAGVIGFATLGALRLSIGASITPSAPFSALSVTNTLTAGGLSVTGNSFLGGADDTFQVNNGLIFNDASVDNTLQIGDALDARLHINNSLGNQLLLEGPVNNERANFSLISTGLDVTVFGDSVYGTYSFLAGDAINPVINRMEINASGNVGINQINPFHSRLHINSLTDQLRLEGPANFQTADFNLDGDNLDLLVSGDGARGTFSLRAEGSVLPPLSRLFIDSAGNVGINNASPSERLHVAGGGIRVDGGGIRVEDSFPEFELVGSSGSDLIVVGVSGEVQLYADPNNTQANSGYLFHVDGSGSSAEVLYINANGLGIGTTSPQGNLHILESSPRIRIEDSDGTNQYMQLENSSGASIITARNNTANGVFQVRQFDGTTVSTPIFMNASGNVGIKTGSSVDSGSSLHVQESDAALPATSGASCALFERAGNAYITIGTANTGVSGIYFADTDSATIGRVAFDHATNRLEFWSNGLRASVDATGIFRGVWNDNGSSNTNSQIRVLTQAQYDAIGTPDTNTLYFIK